VSMMSVSAPDGVGVGLGLGLGEGVGAIDVCPRS
jgi:hypothetical protein